MTELNNGENISTQHPRDEELIRYFSGTLAEGVHETVQVHLVDCDECLETFNDVRDFFELYRHGEQMINEDIAQQWIRFANRIKQAPAASTRLSEQPPPGSRLNVVPVYALAAMVVLAVVLGLLALSQRRQNRTLVERLQRVEQDKAAAQAEQEKSTERLRQLEQETVGLKEKARLASEKPTPQPEFSDKPELNVPIYDLYARDFNRRSANDSEVNRISPPASANSIVLILNGSGVAASASYGIDIVAEDGQTIWRGKGLTKGQLGNLTVRIDRALFPNGNYRLRLFGHNGGRAVAEYLIRVE